MRVWSIVLLNFILNSSKICFFHCRWRICKLGTCLYYWLYFLDTTYGRHRLTVTGPVQIWFLIKKTLGETEPSRYTFTINLTSRHKQTMDLTKFGFTTSKKKRRSWRWKERKEKTIWNKEGEKLPGKLGRRVPRCQACSTTWRGGEHRWINTESHVLPDLRKAYLIKTNCWCSVYIFINMK